MSEITHEINEDGFLVIEKRSCSCGRIQRLQLPIEKVLSDIDKIENDEMVQQLEFIFCKGE